MGRFSPRERIEGLVEAANRELRRIQQEIKADLDFLLKPPPFSSLESGNVRLAVRGFVRVAPRGAQVVTIDQATRETQSLEARIMVESMDGGTLTVRAIQGTVNQLASVEITQPGMVVATSNGAGNYSLTFAPGTASEAAVPEVPTDTVQGNVSGVDAQPAPVTLDSLAGDNISWNAGTKAFDAENPLANTPAHTVVARTVGTAGLADNVGLPVQSFVVRLDGDIVAHAFATLFGDRLTYDPGTGVVEADDQISALTASNGVVRVLNDFQEATQAAQTVKVNATDGVARPLPLGLVDHSFLANTGLGIQARGLAAFFGARLTYDPGTGTVSADDQVGSLTASNGVDRVGDDFRLEEIFDNSILLNNSGSFGIPAAFNLNTFTLFGRPGAGAAGVVSPGTHTMVGRIAGDIVGHSLFTLFGGSNLSYDGAGQASSFTPVLASAFLTNANQITILDSTTIGWTHANVGGAAQISAFIEGGSVTPFHFDDIPGNTVLANPQGTTNVVQTVLVNSHSFYGRKGGNSGSQSLSGLAGSNMSYNTGTGQFDVSVPSSGGRLIAATALSSGTHFFNASTNRVVVELKGGGGGGRGASSTVDTSGGGGGEGATIIVHRTSPGSSMSVTVGGGGSGGSGASNGTFGGDSSVTIGGLTYTAGGGGGGQAQLGGAGGVPSGSTSGRLKATRGAPGEGLFKIFLDSDITTRSGAGGGTGGGRSLVDGAATGNGNSGGTASGGGGSAALSAGSSVTGGSGGSGYAFVYEYS